jgi:hypothetical protein
MENTIRVEVELPREALAKLLEIDGVSVVRSLLVIDEERLRHRIDDAVAVLLGNGSVIVKRRLGVVRHDAMRARSGAEALDRG